MLKHFLLFLFVASFLSTALPAQQSGDVSAAPSARASAVTYEAEPPEAAAPTPAAEAGPDRTELNLLGQVDSESGEARRNENVPLTLIDNNVLKDLNRRMGTSATLVDEMAVEQGYFGTEYGGSPSTPPHLSSTDVSGIHGDVNWTHDNSLFRARSFFQVGSVQPARSNDYGFVVGVPLWRGAAITVDGNQGRLRGQVNGNILVPSAEERTPLTTDAADAEIIQQIFNAFPLELPNRTDINPRALNTNAPQNIDNDHIGGVLDQNLGAKDRLSLRYGFTLQNVEAFQLVGGQNPDTTTRNHSTRITWSRAWDPATTTDFTVGFDRVGSFLVPDDTSIGQIFMFGREIQYLGPGSTVPLDRAQNTFRYAGNFQQIRGDHTLTFGFDVLRRQTNGSEGGQHRGTFLFGSDFGRDVITNLRMGTPSSYKVAIGNVHRGFRDWRMQFYAGDTWRVSTNFTMNVGLQYRPSTAPYEVNDLSEIPFGSDTDNLGPQIGLAYRLPGKWGTMRAAYGLHYGEIFPTTYMQTRFNAPSNIIVSVDAPKLSDPLAGLSDSDLSPDARSNVYQLAPDLQTPYAHLYSYSWEFEPHRDWQLELGYVGSRAHKLLATWMLNRAVPVEGIPQLSETVNERRPDDRYYSINYVLNGSRAYYDAAKVTLQIPSWRGLSMEASYWFSKSIDLGTSYTNTAAGMDAGQSRSPSQFAYQEELKGLSDFDQPHAMLWRIGYTTPVMPTAPSWVRNVLGQWDLSSVLLLKSGTPFSVISSDSAGWGNVDGEGHDNPMLLDPSILGRAIDHPDTSVADLPLEAFGTIEPTEMHGNLGRNTFRKDGIANVNLALSRMWTIAGEKSLLFRAESLNFTNHPQFTAPDSQISSSTFATITNTLNEGRTFRFTLQLGF